MRFLAVLQVGAFPFLSQGHSTPMPLASFTSWSASDCLGLKLFKTQTFSSTGYFFGGGKGVEGLTTFLRPYILRPASSV